MTHQAGSGSVRERGWLGQKVIYNYYEVPSGTKVRLRGEGEEIQLAVYLARGARGCFFELLKRNHHKTGQRLNMVEASRQFPRPFIVVSVPKKSIPRRLS